MRAVTRSPGRPFRMRIGRAQDSPGSGLAPVPGASPGSAGAEAPGGAAGPVRLTIEVSWTVPEGVEAGGAQPATAGGVELEVSEGRVLDALAWPSGVEPEPRGERVWRLGASDHAGRVRARLEVAVGANLIVRAAGQSLRLPVASILDGPQRTPFQTPVEIVVERVAWDSLPVALGEADTSGAGVVAPGATIPLNVGLNVVTPEPAQVVVRCTAEMRPLRGGEAVWQHEWREVVATSLGSPPTFVLQVAAPKAEGLYVLDLHAAWEPGPAPEREDPPDRPPDPPGAEGGVAGGSGHGDGEPADHAGGARAEGPRNGPRAAPAGARAGGRLVRSDADAEQPAVGHGAVTDGGARTPRRGRCPTGAVEATRRDRLTGWITRAGPEVAQLGPADASGLAWSAVGLKVAHPGRPHRLSLTVAGGHPAALGVAMIGPAGPTPGQRPRLLLDACASGPPILPEGGPRPAFSWLVWPDTVDPVLVLVNRATGSPVQVGAVTLTELPDLPPGPAIEEPAGTHARCWPGADGRRRARAVRRRGGGQIRPERHLDRGTEPRRVRGRHCGASSVLLSEGLSDRPRRRALDGQAAEDAIGPDRLDLALRVLGRQGIATWLELGFAGALPGLPAPGSPEALAMRAGAARPSRTGRWHVADLSPAQPGGRRCASPEGDRGGGRAPVATTTAGGAELSGVLVRLGPGPTLLGRARHGIRRRHVRPVREGVVRHRDGPRAAGRGGRRPRAVPGAGEIPGRLGADALADLAVAQAGGAVSDLAEAAGKAAPGVALVVVTPGLGESPAASEARRADLAGLAPSLAWRAVGLDLDAWPAGEHPPIVLRGVCLSPDDLAHDLATSPELDAKVAARPARPAGRPGRCHRMARTAPGGPAPASG